MSEPNPKIYLLPNLMTTGNLFCGFTATLKILEGANLREIARINKQQARQAADSDRGQQQQGKGDTPDNLAAAQTESDRRQLYHGSFILTQTREVDGRIRKILCFVVS